MSFIGGRKPREVYGRRRVEANARRSAGSVDVRNEAPGAGSVGVIFGAEGLAQEPLLGVDARQQDGKRQHRENNAHARSEDQPPAEREHEETEIARVANDSIKPATDQSVFGLDRNESAKAPPEHEHRRKTKNAAGRIKKDSEPAHAFAAKS